MHAQADELSNHMTLYNTLGILSLPRSPRSATAGCAAFCRCSAGWWAGRVRSVTQDDCHIFCTPDQIEAEFTRAIEVIRG